MDAPAWTLPLTSLGQPCFIAIFNSTWITASRLCCATRRRAPECNRNAPAPAHLSRYLTLKWNSSNRSLIAGVLSGTYGLAGLTIGSQTGDNSRLNLESSRRVRCPELGHFIFGPV